MQTQSERETQAYLAELDRETAKLIREGMSPWEATKKAGEVVRRRREVSAREQREG